MEFVFLFFLLITSLDVFSKCDETPSFAQIDKAYKAAAIGYFYRAKDKVTFRPVVCMNRENCADIDLSHFPKYKRGTSWNRVWDREGANSETLEIINTTETTFDKAVIAQKKNVAKAIIAEKNGLRQLVKKSTTDILNTIPVEQCFSLTSTIMLTDNYSFYSNNSSADAQTHITPTNYYEKNYKITYKDEKMKGCGCEDLFDQEKKELNAFFYSNRIFGHYEKREDKLFFIEELYDSQSLIKYEHVRDIELEEKDKCNIFVNDFLGKHLYLRTPKEIDPGIRKLPYINACRSITNVLVDK